MRLVHTFLRKKIALRILRGAIDRQNPRSTIRMPVIHRPARLIIISIDAVQDGCGKGPDHRKKDLRKIIAGIIAWQ
jgi:hypothetical protein